ncbi:GNAT family N-acetyltransferase [Streptomyces sp. NPDC005046]
MEQPLDVPELAAGGEFTLRPWRLSDLPLVREASEDDYIPLITTVPSPYSEPAGVAFIERQWGRATKGAGYPFVIVTSDDRPVGQVGLWMKDLEQGRPGMLRGRSAGGSGHGRKSTESTGSVVGTERRTSRQQRGLRLRIPTWAVPRRSSHPA